MINGKHLVVCIGFLVMDLAAGAQTGMAQSFAEDFSDSILRNFQYGSTGVKDDFKWKTGVESLSEPGTRILRFRIDPADSAGAGRGPEIISKEYTYYGSYSARVKIPDVRKVQPNTGAVVGYFTYSTISKVGYAGTPDTLAGLQDQPETIPAIPGYDASAKFYTYGFDWYPDRLRWWINDPATGKKIVLWDYTGSKLGIPTNKTKYRMNFWHTGNWAVETNPLSLEKPLHPYELEVDWMKYKRHG